MNMNKAGIKLTACAAVLAVAFPVMAQEASKKDEGIQEVIVTASKRKESIQTVPMSVEALTGTSLQKMNVQKFEDIEKLSPGLVLNPADGRGQNVALRGVTFDPDTGASPTVQIYWNETPIGTSDAFRGLFDIGRIEVLRGPQGTLRGQTSPAGSITIATERPDLDEVEGRLIQTFGSQKQRNTQAAVNAPLIPGKLAVRVAGLYAHTENGVRNVNNGSVNSDQAHGGRISVLYQPASNIEVLLVHQQLTSENTNDPLHSGMPAAGQGNGPQVDIDDRLSVIDGNFIFNNKAKLTSLSMAWDLGGHKLSYIGGFQQSEETDDRDLDATNVIPGWAMQQVVTLAAKQRTHELRVESTGSRFWNYMAGAYYSYNDAASSFTQPVAYYFPAAYATPLTTPLKGYTAPGSFGKGTALFTDHRFALSDLDQLQLGLRVQKNKSYSQQYMDIFGTTAPAMPEERAHRDTKAWTGSASYRHNFSKAVMAYASYAGGYRPGGTVSFLTTPGLDPDLINYKAEKSQSIELGIKSTLFDRKLVLNANVFQQKIKNYIARANDIDVRVGAVAGEPKGPGPGGTYPGDPSGGINLNTNGDVLTRGVEATAIWSILPNWRAQVSASYIDAHYEGASLYCNDNNNDGIPDITGSGVQPGRQVSVCGSERALADTNGIQPGKFGMVIQSEYSHNLGNYDGFARGLARYVAPSYSLAEGRHISSFVPVDLYLGVRDPSQRWELSLWSQNLFDRSTTVINKVGYFGGLAGGYSTSAIPQERKVGVTLRYDF